ncbi:hypothetical protein BJ170DRAFT_333930 [Xylariales sp. AK1849]|nr:hypothetical protein BJ170DRAFT_333930 [Xylariales sp. AK1849]
MAPRSFAEWVVGSNAATRKKRQTQSRVVSFDWTTDDETGDDTVEIRVPRGRRTKGKQVRFQDSRKPAVTGSSEDTTEAERRNKSKDASEVSTDDNTIGDEVTTTEEPDSDCPYGTCIAGRKRLKNAKQGRKKKAEASGDDTETDAEIHAKHLAKKEAKAKANGKKWKKKKTESDSETAVETNEDVTKDKDSDKRLSEESEATDTEQSEGKPSKAKGKKGKKQGDDARDGSKGDQRKTKAEKKAEKAKESTPPKQKEKRSKLPPFHQPPEIRRPELLLPIHAQVLQVEHAVEGMEDPRPNAFYDVEHGIMRVYHGPSYGNPNGALYPRRVYNNQTLPIGTPHPAHNPWYNGFPRGVQPSAPPVQWAAGQPHGAPVNNPWFSGQGTVTVPGPADPSKPDRISDPKNPFYGAEIPPMPRSTTGNPFDASPSLRASKHKKDRENGFPSNVVPFTPLDAGSPANSGGSRAKADSNALWGIQSAQGSAKNSSVKEKEKEKTKHPFNKPYTQEDSNSLDAFLDQQRQKIASKNLSKQGSQKNDDGWGNQKDNSNNAGGGWGDGNTAGGNDAWGVNDDPNNNDGGEWGGNDNSNNAGGGWGGNLPARDDNQNNGTGDGWGHDDHNQNDNANTWGENTRDQNNKDNSRNNNWGAPVRNDDTRSQNSNRSKDPRNSNVPGAWPQTPAPRNGGNVFGGDESNRAGSNRAAGNGSPSTAGNVATHGDDWGDTSKGNGRDNSWGDGGGGGNSWQDPSAAQETGGYWDNEGKGTEKHVDQQPKSGW